MEQVGQSNNFVLKGDIVYSAGINALKTFKNSFLICKNGISMGVFPQIPREFSSFPVRDFKDKLIIPGLVDLHCHAPQYSRRGMGMDLELLEWLEKYTFPEEAKYGDMEYAQNSYASLVKDLTKSPNTRTVFFGTIHTPTVLLLMEMLEKSGHVSGVGKVNMDRNVPDSISEKTAEASVAATQTWLEQYYAKAASLPNTFPVLTPRFLPSCSGSLLKALSGLQKKYRLPVQSHLSENKNEIAWVKELFPQSSCYGDAYAGFDLFGDSESLENKAPAIMAHCVWSGSEETALIKKQGVFVAHCPESNINLSSGIAPVRHYLDMGIKTGLGSDVAGGANISIFKAMVYAIQSSKLRNCLVDKNEAPLTVAEAFYLGTAGGGEFFAEAGGPDALGPLPGKCGSFEAGYDFDALVIDDGDLCKDKELSLAQRLERVIYLCGNRHISAKYVRGLKIR
ncbi:MAG: amidohydrolase family protein [Treponema sp.]|jgi:guanine deaminase|nr:amidohydrolase family protein [Treponema sp.]